MALLDGVRDIAGRLKAHNVVVTTAGIAFYGLLALVPTLIALISIYGLITDPSEIEDQVAEAAGSLDETTRRFITDLLTDIVGERTESGSDPNTLGRWIALIGSIALALFSASGAVQKLIATVSVAYETVERRPGLIVRLMAYTYTLGAILGVVMIGLVTAAAPPLLDRADLGDAASTVLSIMRFPVLALLFGAALTLLYRYGPDRDPRTPWRNPGAVVATLLFVLFAVAFSLYSSSVGLLPASYGMLGSIAVLMIFLQLTALAVIVGAEVNAVIEGRRASADARAMAVAGASDGQTVAVATGPGAGAAGANGSGAGSRTLGFGKAMAGLVALYVLARSPGDD